MCSLLAEGQQQQACICHDPVSCCLHRHETPVGQQLRPCNLLHLSLLQVELAKKREAAKAAAEQRERQANRGWLSWAWGGSGVTPAKKDGHEEEEDGDMRGELNEEERLALQDLASEQVDALKDGERLSFGPD